MLSGKAWVCPYIFYSLGIIPRREIVGHMVNLCLISEQLSNYFRKRLHHFTSHQQCMSFDFSTSLPTLNIFLL